MKWDTVIEQKTVELGRYLVGRTVGLDFSEPSPDLRRVDDSGLRRRILSLTQQEARRLGIGKSTLHFLRKKATSADLFVVHRKTLKKIDRTQLTHHVVSVQRRLGGETESSARRSQS